MTEGTLALLIPFAFFALVGLLAWMVLYFRQRKNLEVQQTIRMALERGHELAPGLIEQLGNGAAQPKRDTRIGIIWIAVALGMAMMGFFAPDPTGNAFKGMLAMGSIPLMIGIAYLLMSRMARAPRPA
ncbi:DUF6249 domain-containing protein [Microbulbifer guangxiensis]|uniref:DUF6249 domain-containing protein n=1 Tax=Microbulbifer guangxiensis TaxID=2904249 RepID=UPI001F33956E|nr:DUF6249 domain-containing protein [Microbulbifer guangxiensis]